MHSQSLSMILIVADVHGVTRLVSATSAVKLCSPSTASSLRIVIGTRKVSPFTVVVAGSVTTRGLAES